MQDPTRLEQENMPESRQVLRTDRLLSVADPFQVFESSRQITTLPYLLRHRGGEHGHTLNRMSGGHSFIKMNELSLALKTMGRMSLKTIKLSKTEASQVALVVKHPRAM